MKKDNLNDINKEILKVFEKFDIKEHEMLTVYQNCFNDFKLNFQTNIKIENKYLNMIRDIVWYNFERQDEKDLSKWGNVFNHFMHMCDESDFIEYEEIYPLINELNDIHKRLCSEQVFFVSLHGSDSLFNEKTKVNFIDKKQKKTFENDKVSVKELTCYVFDELNGYEIEKIKLNSLIDELLTVLRKAEANQTKVEVTFL